VNYSKLFVSSSQIFTGSHKPFANADYVVLGVPFDSTSTYRCGAKLAPNYIREASLNIELYSFRSENTVEDLSIHDVGNLDVLDLNETLKRVELVVSGFLEAKKTPVLIGGEHTITLGATRAVGGNVAIISFDAHLDLRTEYLKRTISHATFMRRIEEELKPTKIIAIGTRAACKEELNHAKNVGIEFITSNKVMNQNVKETIDYVNKLLKDCEQTYITIDLDVLDPAFAPSVQNPEPGGLSTDRFLDILCGLCDSRTVALDAVEVTPHFDFGITSIQAAKTIFEALCSLGKAKDGKSS